MSVRGFVSCLFFFRFHNTKDGMTNAQKNSLINLAEHIYRRSYVLCMKFLFVEMLFLVDFCRNHSGRRQAERFGAILLRMICLCTGVVALIHVM